MGKSSRKATFRSHFTLPVYVQTPIWAFQDRENDRNEGMAWVKFKSRTKWQSGERSRISTAQRRW